MGELANIRVVPRKEMGGMAVLDGKNRDVHTPSQLDSEDARARLSQLEEWLEHERMRQSQNRYQQALDDDFFDGLQWSEDDAAELMERGQAPLVYNKIMPTIRWITGTEKRTRIDFKVYPRGDEDQDGAEAKTKLMKYVQDVNKSAFARSRAFEDALRAGVGWLETGVRGDPTECLIYDRYESWRNILFDSLGNERDQRDWRYMVRQKWVDLDVALMLFPHRAEQIKANSTIDDISADSKDSDEWYLGSMLFDQNMGSMIASRRSFVDGATTIFNRRRRVKMYEMWYRYPTRTMIVEGGTHHGKEYDQNHQAMRQELAQDACGLIDRVTLKMRCGIFMRGTFLWDGRSPYKHDKFPFTPIWGNRRARDGMPFGAIRNMRDPQEDMNKRMSKALHAGSTKRVKVEMGAVDDYEELRAEAARPDAMLVYKKGYNLEVETDHDVAAQHMQFAEVDAKMLQDVAGVTDENMGRRTNATSGIAIERRQEQGSAVTTDYFDNLRYGTQVHGEKMLANIEQFMDMPLQFRVLGPKSRFEQGRVNWPREDGSIENDITSSQADFVVGTQDFRETVRQQMFEVLLEMVMKIAQVNVEIAMKLLDDVLELSDLPEKDDIIATVREITGKAPRDKKLSPQEQKAVEAAKAREAAKQQLLEEVAMKGEMAKVDTEVAKGQKLLAETEKIMSEIGVTEGGDSGEMAKLREDTAKLVAALKDKVSQAQMALQVARGQAADDSATVLEKARMDNATKLEIAHMGSSTTLAGAAISAKSSETIAEISDDTQKLIDGLKGKLTDVSAQVKALKKAKAKPAAKSKK